MPVTIKDVAVASQSSVTTVSRVLSRSDYPVSDKLRKRIMKVAKDLNYTPNLAARSLKTNASTEIAIVVPSIINPYYTSIIKGLEEQLYRTNLGMLIYILGKNGRDPAMIQESIRSRRMAGIIAATDSVDDAFFKELCTLKQNGTPVLLVDSQRCDNCELHGIFFDYFKGAGMAAEYLINMGHKDIAFATTHLDRKSRVLRYNGFCEALQRSGIPLADNRLLVCSSDSTYHAGVELADIIVCMRDEITAVAAINDVIAAGIIMGLNMRGIRVPEDISVIGFDNGVFAEVCYPPLTTINVPAEKIGKLAAASLLTEISGDAMECSVFMEPGIVERKSVCRQQQRR